MYGSKSGDLIKFVDANKLQMVTVGRLVRCWLIENRTSLRGTKLQIHGLLLHLVSNFRSNDLKLQIQGNQSRPFPLHTPLVRLKALTVLIEHPHDSMNERLYLFVSTTQLQCKMATLSINVV